MPKKFWRFQNEASGNAELILYGEISDSSWFDDEITPKEFSNDLYSLGNVDSLTVRINSGGGDVFAAETIGNLLEQSKANVTAVIDGLCASAATIVACHCDKVIASSDSVYMIHPVQIGISGYVDSTDLENYLKSLNTVREVIVNLYARKTGRAVDEVSALMDETSWWTGEQARENGFVDEIINNDKSVIENRNGVLFVNSINSNLPFENAPSFIKDSIANSDSIKENSKEEKELDDGKVVTIDDLRAAYPELVGEIENAARASGAEAERSRIHSIEDMELPGCKDLSEKAKYTEPMSAEDFAVEVIRSAKAKGMDYLNSVKSDVKNSGLNEISENPQSQKRDEFLDAIRGLNK